MGDHNISVEYNEAFGKEIFFKQQRTGFARAGKGTKTLKHARCKRSLQSRECCFGNINSFSGKRATRTRSGSIPPVRRQVKKQATATGDMTCRRLSDGASNSAVGATSSHHRQWTRHMELNNVTARLTATHGLYDKKLHDRPRALQTATILSLFVFARSSLRSSLQ